MLHFMIMMFSEYRTCFGSGNIIELYKSYAVENLCLKTESFILHTRCDIISVLYIILYILKNRHYLSSLCEIKIIIKIIKLRIYKHKILKNEIIKL